MGRFLINLIGGISFLVFAIVCICMKMEGLAKQYLA
ncbi:Uncharacterised protein [Moraxella ovis]|nr:Uncharacterised protein [Moraxella ovis]STZ06759.1 Uncharacterised protein [Moraxella ovis]